LNIAVIGAGPAGLAAAEVLSGAGRSVHLFDAMPSVGRKFLLAGKGGLNLTHAEPFDAFVTRYGERAPPSSHCCVTLTPTRCAPGRPGWVWTPSWARRSGCFPPT
jgi:predicted flavoprotein YhiN